MTLDRRALLGSMMAAGAAGLPRAAQAQAPAWPTRPVRIVVPFTPAGPVDTIARLVAPKLEAAWGQTVLIENRAGAGGNVGAQAVARSAPDGHTLLLCASSLAINPGIYRNMPFDTARDLVACVRLTAAPFVLVVHPSIPARSLPEFIAWLKASPGAANYASAGSGTGNHLGAELFKQMAGVEMVHVPFPGAAPATTALLAGQTPIMVNNMVSALPHLPDGRLFALGVTTLQRSPALPEVPAIAEVLPGYEVSAWYGLLAPAGTPAPVIAAIHRGGEAAIMAPDVRERITAQGMEAAPQNPEEFGRFVAAELVKWARVAQLAKAQVD